MQQPAVASKIAYNTLFGLIAFVLARMAHVILFIMVSRLVGPAEAGVLTIGLSFLAIAGSFSTWGLDQILIRDSAQDLSQTGRYLSNFLLMRVLLCIAVAILLSGLFIFKPYKPEVLGPVFVITLIIFPEGILKLSQAVFIAHQKMGYVTLTGALAGAFKLVLAGGALFFGYQMMGVALGLLAANIIVALVGLMLVFWKFIPWRWNINLAFCLQQIRVAAPFVLIAGTFIIDNQLDTLLVSWQVGEDQVGFYGAAITLIVGIGFIPQAYRDAVFPALSHAYVNNMTRMHQLYQRSYKYLLIMAIPITLGLITLANPILNWIYGPVYAVTVPVLQILAVAVGISFLFILHNRLLIVANQQSKIAMFLAIGLIINVIINLSMVPVLGITGAAIARLTSNLLVFALIYRAFYKGIYAFNAGPIWFRPVISGAFMMVIIMALRSWPLWPLILTGAGAYVIALLVLGTFSRREIVAWLEIIKLRKLAKQLP